MANFLDELEPVEPARRGVDLSTFEGKRYKLEDVEEMPEMQFPDPKTGQKRTVKNMRVRTEVITNLEKSDGTKIPVRATEMFPLKQKTDGSWGWSTHEKGKLKRFMDKQKVSEPKNLFDGKHTAIVRLREGSDGNNYLGFFTE